jgi:hypothetical protein
MSFRALSILLLIITPTSAADESALVGYLVQSVCLDPAGGPAAGTPLDTGCQSRRPQTASDPAFYRKHDWPNADDAALQRSGYQASDSVLVERGGRRWIVKGRRAGR